MNRQRQLGNLPERLGPMARRFAAYWLSLPCQDLVPARSALDPVAIPDLLPHFMLWEINDVVHARFRLVGSAVRDWFGTELTGKPVLDIHAEGSRHKAVQAGAVMAATPCGAWGLMALRSPTLYDFLVEVLCLPMLDAEGKVGLFANTMERVQDRRFFDAMAASGARAINFVEHRFVDIGAGLPQLRGPEG
ncbi:MAG: PAS domain-containing protein [Rhodospirillaceae bacterium]|nr:PAS domain-containing protein [Rhodospirillaceae bacterium]